MQAHEMENLPKWRMRQVQMSLSKVVAAILSIKWGLNTPRVDLERAGPPSQRES